MRILEEIGVDFRGDPEALALWREAGAEVSGERIRIPRELAMALLAFAPAQFTQHARNPERSVEIGGSNLVLAPVYGPPYVRDLNGTRRRGTLEDLVNFIKLAYRLPALNHSGGIICEPQDVPIPKRHLEIFRAHVRYSDKPFMGAVNAPERAMDCVEMARIVFGLADADERTVLISLVNGNSPLVWDATMLGAMKVYARHRQALLVSPFIMQGANTPVTTAGALAQLNAEAVAGMAFAQLVRPGTVRSSMAIRSPRCPCSRVRPHTAPRKRSFSAWRSPSSRVATACRPAPRECVPARRPAMRTRARSR